MKVRHWIFVAALLVIGVGAASLMGPTRAAPEAAAVVAAPVDVTVAAGPPAGASELALVAPLAPGSDLAGWTVDTIEGVQNGAMAVVVHRQDEHTRLQIALDDPSGALPPARTGRYAVYYGELRDGVQAQALADALQAVIATHADVAPPAGLGALAIVARGGT